MLSSLILDNWQTEITSKTTSVIVDKDPSEIKALEEAFENVKIKFCYFHNINNIGQKLKGEPLVNKFKILNIFKAMPNDISREKFD